METNRIYNGDCLDLIKEMPGECIDAVITDPPYSSQMQHNGQASVASDLNICKPFFRQILKEIKRVLKPNGLVYWFCDFRSYGFFYDLFADILPVKNMLVWDKLGRTSQYYWFSHELIIFSINGSLNTTDNSNGIFLPSIFKEDGFGNGATKSDGEKIHPTQKPIKVISKLIKDSTKEGDLVLDCFAGSCTTAVSAIYNKRNFICFELQEQYCEIGQKRINDAKYNFDFQTEELIGNKLFF